MENAINIITVNLPKTKHDYAMENAINIITFNLPKFRFQTPSQINVHALTPTFILSAIIPICNSTVKNSDQMIPPAWTL
jgi:hypothetical protein